MAPVELFMEAIFVLIEFQRRRRAPVSLGREVDDEAWQCELPRVKNEHATRLHSFAFAGGLVSLEVFGVDVLELQGDATPHHADAIDGVDQCVGLTLEDVARGVLDHGCAPLIQ